MKIKASPWGGGGEEVSSYMDEPDRHFLFSFPALSYLHHALRNEEVPQVLTEVCLASTSMIEPKFGRNRWPLEHEEIFGVLSITRL